MKLFFKIFFYYFFFQADSEHPVLAAGDPERMNMKKCEELGGIPYHINVVNFMVRLFKKLTPRWLFVYMTKRKTELLCCIKT